MKIPKQLKKKLPKYPDGGKTKSNKMTLSNDQVDQYSRALKSVDPEGEDYFKIQNQIDQLPQSDRDRISSYSNSPQFKKLMEKEAGVNLNFLMPDKTGKYVDSGVNAFDAILSLPSNISKGTKSLIDLTKKKPNPNTYGPNIPTRNLKEYKGETPMYNTNYDYPETSNYYKIKKEYSPKKEGRFSAKMGQDMTNPVTYILPDLMHTNKYDRVSAVTKSYSKELEDAYKYLGQAPDASKKYPNGGKILPKYGDGDITTDPKLTGYDSYGRPSNNPYEQSAGTNSETNYAALGQVGLQLGSSMNANQGLTGRDKELANETSMNAAADQVIQMIPGFGQFYGMAKGASDMGRSMIGKDEQGYAHSNMEQAADNFMNPTHQSIISNASKGQYGEALMSAFINPAIGSIVGEVFKGTKFGDKATAYGRGEKIFSNGGEIENAWGQPNAEVEKQENAITPNGQFVQYNGPSHEQGGIPTRLPGGTDVFSDRLKMPGTKKTFAKLNKPNDTTKEDKILSDNKANTIAKATATLMKLAKQTNSDRLFQAQEALKQSKIDKYTMKLGGVVKYPDGGKIVDAQGFPIDKTGRRLGPEEQLGFSRDLNLNRLYTSNYGSSYNVPLTQAGTPLKTGTTTPTQPGTQPGFVYDPALGTYDQQWNAHLKKINLGSFAKGGRIPKYEYGDTTPRLKPMESDEIELQDLDFGYRDPAVEAAWTNIQAGTQNNPTQNNGPYSINKSSAQIIGDSQNNSNNPNSKGINWRNMALQGGLGLMNNLGNIYDLHRSKDVEVDKYDRMNPALLDPTASLRDAENAKKIAEYNIRNASVGHSGGYLANRVGSDVSLVLAKDKISREYQNMNAGIKNSAQQYNIEQHKAEDIANMQNRAQSRNIKANAISNIGQNVVGQYGDTRRTEADKDKIELIKSMYPSIKNDPEIMAYYKKKGWLTDAEIKELDRQYVSKKS